MNKINKLISGLINKKLSEKNKILYLPIEVVVNPMIRTKIIKNKPHYVHLETTDKVN